MKKENYYKFMYILSILLVVGFAIGLLIDYYEYDSITTSAPFYVNIIIRGVEFILPSILVLIVGVICKRKS